MDQQMIDLSNGGVAVVVLSKDYELASEFSFNPRIVPLSTDQLSGDSDQILQKLPGNAKVAVLSDGLPSHVYGALLRALDKRGVVYLKRKNQAALDQAISGLFPKAPAKDNGLSTVKEVAEESARKIAPHGAISQFVKENANLTKSNAEEARRLFRMATARGLQTTFGSLSQAIAVQKRKGSITGNPVSVMSKQAQALKILNEAIENLGLIRDYVESTESENTQLRERIDQIKAVFGKL